MGYHFFRAPDGDRCDPCEPGSFSSAENRKRCDLCPAGTFSPVSRATACEFCSGSAAGTSQCTPYQTQVNIADIVGGVVGGVVMVIGLVATIIKCKDMH